MEYIADNAFEGNTTVTEVTLNEGVTEIGYEAFYGCSSLRSITIPESVTTIGDWAFEDCSALETLSLPLSLESVGANAFYLCQNLKLRVFEDTYAETYVKENNLPYELMSMDESTARVFLKDPEGKTITGGYTVVWSNADTGEALFRGNPLRNTVTGERYIYEIVPEEALAVRYDIPEAQTLLVSDEHDGIEIPLTERAKSTITGTVAAADSGAVSGVAIRVNQRFSADCVKEFSVDVSNKGEFYSELSAADTVITVSCDGYYDQTVNLTAEQMKQQSSIPVNINLEQLPTNHISMTFSEQTVSALGNGGLMGSGMLFSLRNVTRNRPIDSFVFQNSKLVVNNEDVSSGDTVEIRVSSESDLFAPVTVSCILDRNRCGSANVVLVENGHVNIKQIDGVEKATVLLFNSSGGLVQTVKIDRAGAYESIPLPAGKYYVIAMDNVSMAEHISMRSQLSKFGLVSGTDYVQKSVTVSAGKIASVSSLLVPSFSGENLDYLVSGKSSFTVSSSSPVVGQYIAMSLKYEIDAKYVASHPKIRISLSDGLAFIAGSLTVNGQSAASTNVDNQITIETADGTAEGNIRFYVLPTAKGEKTVSASVSMTVSAGEVYVPVGTQQLIISEEPLHIPERTNKSTLTISGKTVPNCDVTIYDNGAPIATAISNQAGKWQATIQLDDEYDYSRHSVYAVTSGGIYDTHISTSRYRAILDKNYPEVSYVTLTNNPSGDTVFDFENSSVSSANYTYNPAYPTFNFAVAFSGGDLSLISDVYVVAWHQNNASAMVRCEFDADKGEFIGQHDFETFSEVPSSVSVMYKYNGADIEEDLAEKIDGVLDGDLSNIHSEIHQGSDNFWHGNVRFGDSEAYSYSVSIVNSAFDSFDIAQYTSEGYTIASQTNSMIALVDANYLNSILVLPRTEDSVIVAAVSNDQPDEAHTEVIAAFSPSFGDLSILNMAPSDESDQIAVFASSRSGICRKCNNLSVKSILDLARSYTEAEGMSDPNSILMIQALDRIRGLNASTLATIVIHCAGIVPSPGGSTAEAIAGAVQDQIVGSVTPSTEQIIGGLTGGLRDQVEHIIMRLESAGQLYSCAGGENCDCGCSICSGKADNPGVDPVRPLDPLVVTPIADPAGFVYEAVPSNRISGVTATIYEYKYLVDEFGVQSENKIEVKWDAENYGQVNPIITDEEGKFAWDVPEGQWVVKFTKDGYHEANSYHDPAADAEGYLPVPIVQTEINTAIVSTAAPTVNNIRATSEGLEISFSQYMSLHSVNNKTILVMGGKEKIPGHLVPLNEEFNYKGTEKYASAFLFRPKTGYTGSVSVQIQNATNYAGTAMEHVFSRTVNVAWDNTYTITWLNDDGSIIDTTTVERGVVPTHAAPTKAATAGFTYTFAGWTPEIAAAIADATYTATYTAIPVFGTPTFTLPVAIQSIEESAFEGLPITVVEIPTGCENIGKWAFKDCTNLMQIRIPSSVVSIDDTAFDGCGNVFIFGTTNSAAKKFCDSHANCTFVLEHTGA